MTKRGDEWELKPLFPGDPGPMGGPHGPGDPGHEAPPPMDPEPERDEGPVSFRLMRRIELAGRLHHMALGAVMDESGLPPAQAGALKTIIHHPGMSQRELADSLHIQRATATVMLQKMERAELIDRRPDPEDQRVSRIYPTEAAKRLDDENKKSFDAYYEHCFSSFTPEEIAQLRDYLDRLCGSIREVLDNAPKPPVKE